MRSPFRDSWAAVGLVNSYNQSTVLLRASPCCLADCMSAQVLQHGYQIPHVSRNDYRIADICRMIAEYRNFSETIVKFVSCPGGYRPSRFLQNDYSSDATFPKFRISENPSVPSGNPPEIRQTENFSGPESDLENYYFLRLKMRSCQTTTRSTITRVISPCELTCAVCFCFLIHVSTLLNEVVRSHHAESSGNFVRLLWHP